MWYGWIPILSDKEPAVLRGHPLEDTNMFTLCKRDDDDSIRVVYKAGSEFEKTVIVTVEDGFFKMEYPDNDSSEPKYVIMHLIYTLLKRSYHIDITHTADNGLTVVESDNMKSAVTGVADMIVDVCENFIFQAAGMDDVDTLRSLYLESSGSTKYGLSYIARYKKALGDCYSEYLERLTSVSYFIDAIYTTKRDAIQDDLAHQNRELSKSMKWMSEHTESLSVAVLAVTVVSVMMSCIAFAFDHQEIGTLKVATVVMAAIAIPALIIICSRLSRKSRMPSNRFRFQDKS